MRSILLAAISCLIGIAAFAGPILRQNELERHDSLLAAEDHLAASIPLYAVVLFIPSDVSASPTRDGQSAPEHTQPILALIFATHCPTATWDHASGKIVKLYYYGARFYMPEIGRFIQVDPAREFHNPYSYVGNNPVGFVDPTGFESTGEIIERAMTEAALNGQDVKGYFLMLSKLGWNVFGMESVSKTVDRKAISGGDDLTKGDVAWAFVDVATMGKGGGAVAGTRKIAGKAAGALWNLNPFKRGKCIENIANWVDYPFAYHVGKELDGFFPLVDFQKGNLLISLKTTQVPEKAMSWLKSHIRDLASSGAKVDGKDAMMMLDVRVPKGMTGALDELVEYGSEMDIRVIVKEFGD